MRKMDCWNCSAKDDCCHNGNGLIAHRIEEIEYAIINIKMSETDEDLEKAFWHVQAIMIELDYDFQKIIELIMTIYLMIEKEDLDIMCQEMNEQLKKLKKMLLVLIEA